MLGLALIVFKTNDNRYTQQHQKIHKQVKKKTQTVWCFVCCSCFVFLWERKEKQAKKTEKEKHNLVAINQLQIAK